MAENGREYFTSFICGNNIKVQVAKLAKSDFDLVCEFYNREIAKLENKADFYPYKDSEIKSILDGGGVFVGGFDGGELVTLCAIDYDEDYQVGVKKANADFPSFPFEEGLLEFSGLFVCEKLRGNGISQKMTEILLQIKDEVRPNHRLFAVVLESNIPSMKNFFSHGFKLFGWWQMDAEFKFVYLISPKKEDVVLQKPTAKVSLENLVQNLKKGVVFGEVGSDGKFC